MTRYWGQLVVALSVALAAGYWLSSDGHTLLTAAAAGAIVYFTVRWFLAVLFRTRYWLSTDGHRSRNCPNCGQYIYRKSGDWVLRCYRCGWRRGLPGLRYIFHSVPINQLKRTVLGPSLIVVVIALAVVLSGATGQITMSDISIPDENNNGTGPEDTAPGDTAETGDQSEAGDQSLKMATDSDRDGLTDRVETAGDVDDYPLPQADQDRKDLYVRVYVGNGIPPLTAQEKRDLREIWAEMPVSNPSGTEGIDLHITQIQLSESITIDLDSEALRDQEVEIYQQRVPEAAQCSVYSVVLVTPSGDPDVAGRGATPGYVAIVDGEKTQRYNTEYTVRTTTITHELLHNIVGTFRDGSVHTAGGWLNGNPEEHGTEFYMSDKTASRLSENGFAESDYFEQEICD